VIVNSHIVNAVAVAASHWQTPVNALSL